MNVIKTIKYAALGALMYAAATLGMGCSTMPMYDITNEVPIVRFENKQNLTDKLNCWHRIDIKAVDNSDFEGFFAKLVPEYDLSDMVGIEGLSVAAQYIAIQGDDLTRLGLAYGTEIGANTFVKLRLLGPLNDASNPEFDLILCYNTDNFQGGLLILYNLENDTIHGELTATFGRSNIRPFVQLVGDGPIDDLVGRVTAGLELRPKK